MKKFCFALSFLFAITAFGQNNFVYTNDSETPTNTVSAFHINPDGSLTLLPNSPFLTGGMGGAGDVDPQSITSVLVGQRGFVYAANNSDTTISAFFVNPVNGRLTPVAGSPFADGTPNSGSTLSLTVSPNKQFLFAADEATTFVRAFNIAKNGSLTEVAGSPFNVGASPEGVKVTANGKFLIVGLKSAHAVGVFAISATGALSEVSSTPATGLAAAVDSNCANNRVFVANAGSTLIDVFDLSSSGTLTPVPGSPFQSGSTITVNSLTLTPSGQNLLTGNVFDSTVSSLQVAADGSLTPVPGSPFAADDWAGSIATTRDGQFVYTSLFAIASVDGWSIGPDGVLTPVPGRPFTTNQSGVGVQALTVFPPAACPAVATE